MIAPDEGNEFDQDKLRKYQIGRLKYYYAVAEFDSVKTAKTVYQDCDGAEFESSSNFLDLRYIPNDTQFTDEPKEQTTNAPEIYEPTDFVTKVFQLISVFATFHHFFDLGWRW